MYTTELLIYITHAICNMTPYSCFHADCLLISKSEIDIEWTQTCIAVYSFSATWQCPVLLNQHDE